MLPLLSFQAASGNQAVQDLAHQNQENATLVTTLQTELAESRNQLNQKSSEVLGLQEQMSAQQNELEQVKEWNRQFHVEMEKLVAEVELKNKQYIELESAREQELLTMQQVRDDLQKKLDEAEGKVHQSQADVRDLINGKEELTGRVHSLSQENSELKNSVEEIQKSLDTATSTVKSLTSNSSEKERELLYNIDNLQAEVEMGRE